MNPKRFFYGQSLLFSGSGLLGIGIFILLIKLLFDIAYILGGALALAGLILVIVGFITKNT